MSVPVDVVRSLLSGVVGQLRSAHKLHKRLPGVLDDFDEVVRQAQQTLDAVPGPLTNASVVVEMQTQTDDLRVRAATLRAKEVARRSDALAAAKSFGKSTFGMGEVKKAEEEATEALRKFKDKSLAFSKWLTVELLKRLGDKCPSNVEEPVGQLWVFLFGGKGELDVPCSVLFDSLLATTPCEALGPLGRRAWRRQLLGHDEGNCDSRVSVQRLNTLLKEWVKKSAVLEDEEQRFQFVLGKMVGMVADAAYTVEDSVREQLRTELDRARRKDPFEKDRPSAKSVTDLYFDLPAASIPPADDGFISNYSRLYEGMIKQWVGEEESSLILLQGTAGQGKSSSLLYVAQKQRKEAAEASTLSDVRIPIFIHLPSLVDEPAPGKTSGVSLRAAMARQLFGKGADSYENASVDELDLWLSQKSILLLLDSLDEVLFRSQDANAVLEEIRKIPEFLGKNVRIILSSRPLKFEQYNLGNVWAARSAVVQLKPMFQEKRLDYISHVAKHLVPQDKADAVAATLGEATKGPLSSLMVTPLNIRLFVEVVQHRASEDLPDSMWLLFKQSVEGIIKRELYGQKKVFMELKQLLGSHGCLEEVLLSFHREVAYRRHREERVTPFKMEVLLKRSASEFVSDIDFGDVSHRLVEASMERIMLLHLTSKREAFFPIRSIQEFLAAWYIIQRAEEADPGYFRDYLLPVTPLASNTLWRVKSFVCAYLAHSHPKVLLDITERMDTVVDYEGDDTPRYFGTGLLLRETAGDLLCNTSYQSCADLICEEITKRFSDASVLPQWSYFKRTTAEKLLKGILKLAVPDALSSLDLPPVVEIAHTGLTLPPVRAEEGATDATVEWVQSFNPEKVAVHRWKSDKKAGDFMCFVWTRAVWHPQQFLEELVATCKALDDVAPLEAGMRLRLFSKADGSFRPLEHGQPFFKQLAGRRKVCIKVKPKEFKKSHWLLEESGALLYQNVIRSW